MESEVLSSAQPEKRDEIERLLASFPSERVIILSSETIDYNRSIITRLSWFVCLQFRKSIGFIHFHGICWLEEKYIIRLILMIYLNFK